MTLPPLLAQHIEELRGRDYTIEVTEASNEICLVFKDYPLPVGMWNKDRTDMLIIAQPVYPNSKLDMFWVAPGLTLSDGRIPQGGDVRETHCGREWQRFSWHLQTWNPARDNLITYLEVVDHRLHMRK